MVTVASTTIKRQVDQEEGMYCPWNLNSQSIYINLSQLMKAMATQLTRWRTLESV